MTEADSPAERRRRARVAWAHSGLDQPNLAQRTGIEYGTLRGYLRTGGSTSPSADHLLKLGRAAGVPDAFMLYGWDAFREESQVVAELRARLDQVITRFNGELAAIATPEQVVQSEAADAERRQRSSDSSAAKRPSPRRKAR